MPLQKLQFRPGVNREGTNYSNEGGWWSCDKVRFRSGFPEKLGGWARAFPSQFYKGVCRALINWVDLAGNNLIGVGTHLKYYINRSQYYDITPIIHTSAGLSNPFTTTSGVQVVTVTDAGYATSAGQFVTFSGATGFNGLSAAQLNTEFQITKVVSSTVYQITLPTGVTPTGSGTGGGTVGAAYQIPIGLPAETVGNGFGAGVWNGVNVATTYRATLAYTSGATPWILLNPTSTTINVDSTTAFPSAGTIIIDAEVITYTGKTSTSFTGCTRGTNGSTAVNHAYRPAVGTPAPVIVYSVLGYLGTTGWGNATSGAVGVAEQLRLWTNDNYGQNLLISPRGGEIYYWINNTSTFARAVPLRTTADDAPRYTNQVLVSDVSRFVIAMGATSYGDSTYTFDPMLVRWSNQEDPNVWIPDITNQAGEQRLTNGSYIMQAKRNRQEILIWTDSALYSMQYLGPPYVWGFNLMMDNISIMSPNSAIVVNNVAYWMGTDKFYSYSGVVSTLPCSLRQYIYDDISFDQRYQIVSGSNEGFNEVWWYYVSNDEVQAASQAGRIPVVDRYVIYNHLERIWYYGNLSRTYWLDSPLQQWPLAAVGDEFTGQILYHENGVDDNSTASPQPFDCFISSSDFDIGDGHNFGYVWRIIPDINFSGSNNGYPTAYFQVSPRNFPGTGFTKSVVDPINSTQQYSNAIKTYEVQKFTEQLYTRLRGRELTFKVGSGGQLGVNWQLGSPRLDIKPDGRR